MVHRVLTTISFVCCALIIASCALFAVDQMSGASQQQAAETAGTPISNRGPDPDRKQPRRFIDAAARALTYPFHSLASTGSQWADHLLLLVCGLALYGVGLGYVRRHASGLPLRQ
jgi:hypothetical protein